MSGTDNNFESELRVALSNLADEAPAGPSPGSIAERLHRRNASRRWIRTGMAAACLIVACAAVWLALASRPDARRDTQPTELFAQLPKPLAVDAESNLIEAALRQCFAANNVTSNIVVSRDQGQSLSFCATGNNIAAAKLHTELTRILQHFDSVRIDMKDDRLGYMLAAGPNT